MQREKARHCSDMFYDLYSHEKLVKKFFFRVYSLYMCGYHCGATKLYLFKVKLPLRKIWLYTVHKNHTCNLFAGRQGWFPASLSLGTDSPISAEPGRVKVMHCE